MMRKLVILCSLLIVFACSKEEEPNQEQLDLSLTEQIAKLNGAQLFAEAIACSDFDLEGHQLTFLVPNDAALNDFLAELELADFAAMKEQIGQEYYNAWIGSHIIPQAAKFENIHSAFVPTLAQNAKGYTVFQHVWRDKSLLRVNGQMVGIIQKDVDLGDSYLHLTDKVQRPSTLMKLIRAHSGSFSILDRALQVCNMTPLLNSDQARHTIFAPNDDAFDRYFQSMGVGDLDGYLREYGVSELTNLISAHMISGTHQIQAINGTVLQSQLQTAGLQISLNNGNLMLSRTNASYQKEAQVLLTDITAFNGSLNIIDEVLNLP
jgi:uncharacterized surface protein with fasciclin (FAS1) repeats